jgi:beta-lactamase regulating signal transducer with metallopeptidase domain/biopolymer transport protein ExbD
MTDPEYLDSYNTSDNEFDEFNTNTYPTANTIESKLVTKENSYSKTLENHSNKKTSFSIAQFLFIVYIIGVILFSSRIVLLFRWIYKTISQNEVKTQNKIRLVKLKDNLPPFSFLKFVFINEKSLITDSHNQIIAHEEVHVKQNHSIDLLLAHILTIFQWFNPLAWWLQKAIKSNHEYIADSLVVQKGYDLYNYQELLLHQFLKIKSVELVNNFNLISIKQRITMLNKVKSGFGAKLKAFFIIPFAIITFLLFANLTINGPGKVLNNFSFFEIQNNVKQLTGLWKNDKSDSYGYLIKFTEDKFFILENQVKLKEYKYKVKDNKIVLFASNSKPIELKYKIDNNKIKIWWNYSNSSEFTKTNHENSLDVFLADKGLKITPPTVKNYKILEKLELCLFVAMQDDKVMVQNQLGAFSDLEKLILEEKSKFNQLDLNLVTIQLAVDENAEMKQIYELYQILRRNNLLKVAFVCYPDNKSKELNSPHTSFTRRLPPIEGKVEILDVEDLPAMSIDFLEIDATSKENTPELIKPKVSQLITGSKKYIMCLSFDNSTSYKDYTEYNDVVWSVIFKYRNQYALEKYGIEYKQLGKDFQKEVRKKYPIILTQRNIDEPED